MPPGGPVELFERAGWEGALTGDVTVERSVSRDGRLDEVGVPDGNRRREGSRGEAIVDMADGVCDGEEGEELDTRRDRVEEVALVAVVEVELRVQGG